MAIDQLKSEFQENRPHEWKDIVSTEDVCGGEARIAGTRIPVWVIAALNAQGLQTPAILKAYPTLGPNEVENALRYAHGHREEIERAIADKEAL